MARFRAPSVTPSAASSHAHRQRVRDTCSSAKRMPSVDSIPAPCRGHTTPPATESKDRWRCQHGAPKPEQTRVVLPIRRQCTCLYFTSHRFTAYDCTSYTDRTRKPSWKSSSFATDVARSVASSYAPLQEYRWCRALHRSVIWTGGMLPLSSRTSSPSTGLWPSMVPTYEVLDSR